MNNDQNEGQMSFLSNGGELLLQRGCASKPGRERSRIQPDQSPQSEPLRSHQPGVKPGNQQEHWCQPGGPKQQDPSHRSLSERDGVSWGWSVDGCLQPPSSGDGSWPGHQANDQYRREQLPQHPGQQRLSRSQCDPSSVWPGNVPPVNASFARGGDPTTSQDAARTRSRKIGPEHFFVLRHHYQHRDSDSNAGFAAFQEGLVRSPESGRRASRTIREDLGWIEVLMDEDGEPQRVRNLLSNKQGMANTLTTKGLQALQSGQYDHC